MSFRDVSTCIFFNFSQKFPLCPTCMLSWATWLLVEDCYLQYRHESGVNILIYMLATKQICTSPKMLNYSFKYNTAILGNIQVFYGFYGFYPNPQVLPWHGEGVCVQLFLLARAVSHLHHRNHTDQHLLPGLPGGLFLLHVVWR